MAKVSRAQLLPALRAAFPQPQRFPLDVSAVMFALALWESGGQLGYAGDLQRGVSLGLWQVNQATWSKAIGTFDRTMSGEGVEPSSALAYEVSYVQRPNGPVDDLVGSIRAALSTLAARAKTGTDVLVFSPTRDLPVWASIVWQYGSPTLRRFVANESDLSADGFRDWRRRIGADLEPDHEKRQDFIRKTYLSSLRDPEKLVADLIDASQRTGVDFYSASAKQLGVNPKALASGDLSGLRAAFKAGGSLGTVLLAAMGAATLYWSVTQPAANGRGRELRDTVKAEMTTLLGGAALAFLAKGGVL